MKKIAAFIVYTNHWIALGAVSLTLFFYFIYKLNPDLSFILFLYFSTGFIYSFQRWMKVKAGIQFSPERFHWMKRHAVLFSLNMMLMAGGSAIMVYFLSLETTALLIPLALIAVFYVGNKLLPTAKGIRDIPFIKSYVVALFWGIITILLPAIQADQQDWGQAVIPITFVFLLVFALAILFDLRDKFLDSEKQRTVPQILGERRTILLSMGLISIACLILLMAHIAFWPIILILWVYSIILIRIANQPHDDLYFSFFLDSILIIPGFVWLMN